MDSIASRFQKTAGGGAGTTQFAGTRRSKRSAGAPFRACTAARNSAALAMKRSPIAGHSKCSNVPELAEGCFVCSLSRAQPSRCSSLRARVAATYNNRLAS